MENEINIDLRGFLKTMNSRSGILSSISKSSVMKTIRIQLDNYTLVIYGFINGVQLPTFEREISDIFSYNNYLSDLELRFTVEHIEIETPNGEIKSCNEIDGNTFRVINEILKSIQ